MMQIQVEKILKVQSNAPLKLKRGNIIEEVMGELLEITWKQARNESFKVHEMEQLY